jgi:hypothetical protein
MHIRGPAICAVLVSRPWCGGQRLEVENCTPEALAGASYRPAALEIDLPGGSAHGRLPCLWVWPADEQQLPRGLLK